MTLQNYAMKLTPVFVSEREITSYCSSLFNEIKENKQTHGRNDQTLMNHVKSGVILETASVKCIGGNLNLKSFNHQDPHTYIYDFECDNNLFEVKKVSKGDTWLNFNLKNHENENDETLIRADFSVFLKWHKQIGYLITGWYDEVPGGYMVHFKWIIDAPSFNQFVKKSNRSFSGKGTTHYYDVRSAISRGKCLSLF